MTGNSRKTRQQGMTLIEVLIAVAVISITIVLAVNIFLLFSESSSEATNQLHLQANARQMMSLVSERTREGFVDYNFYTGPPSAEPEFLAMRDLDGIQTVFWFYNDGVDTHVYLCDDMPYDMSCDKTVPDPSVDPLWSKMNDEDVYLTTGFFTISPDSDPYFSGSLVPATDDAPLITVVMQLENDIAQSQLFQTTLTPRFYVR